MDYRVTANGAVEVIRNEGTFHGNDFPYRGFPRAFPRRPIELDRLAEIPEDAKQVALAATLADMPPQFVKPLEKWLGHRVETALDIWWHEFGGLPWLVQGEEQIPCPNVDCSWARRGWMMRILAVICNDPPAGLPMVETARDVAKKGGHFDRFLQVQFHICKNCLTIHAGNRCD